MPETGLTSESDRDLVVSFQDGSRDAYNEIYRRYEPRVRRICGRMLTNSQDIEEATQETFLKAYQALGRFNGSYQLGAWLARIASNVCVDHVRFKVRSAQLVALTPEHESLRTENGPEETVVGNNPRVDEAILHLAPLHAEALKLRALGGLSHEEMAGRLAMTPAQVKALLHRARTSFKKAWDKAEALLAAPFFGLRNHFSDRTEGTSATNLMGASPSFGPLFAERVATSAVIVAVALSGVSSIVVQQIPAAPEMVAPPVQEGSAPHLKGSQGGTLSADSDTTVVPRRPRLLAPITSVLGRTSDTLTPDEQSPDNRDDDDDGVGTADTKDVVRKVRQIAAVITEKVDLPSSL